ncbi:MAG: tRNA (adenosine(37)-N6)-dimethylallyltransferase MiaA [Bacteroidetes bacterium]|mgnify:CR=1 FL=1|nr:tRNA (adenosine(37)-N6)-dimethylallyltransferase MiaA [Bacteroidota bacterium]
MPHQKTAYIILGPTASGKSALALKWADYFKTSIISADSRQCFREMNIGVAKPSAGELAKVPHFFINHLSITEEVNVRLFEELAIAFAQKIFQQNDVIIIAGGTGLYIQAFCEGIDTMPDVDSAIRERLRNEFSEKGLYWLQQEVQKKDEAFWQRTDQKNPHRLLRALEIRESTGKSILDFQQNQLIQRNFRIIKIGLEYPREILYERIDKRVDEMVRNGLLHEVESLYPFRRNSALQTVGYKELFAFMDGLYSFEEAISKIKQHTRNYAKRQITWFKKDKEIFWLKGNEPIAIQTLENLK